MEEVGGEGWRRCWLYGLFWKESFCFCGEHRHHHPPFLKSIPESTKYGSVCLLIVRSKVPRGAGLPEKGKGLESSLQPDLSTLFVTKGLIGNGIESCRYDLPRCF